MLVNFKRGSQQNLDAMITNQATTSVGQFNAGTFYLTSDTNRLYFAQEDNKLVDLNQYIHIWDGSSPPLLTDNQFLKAGDIYYLQGSNILAICDDPSTGEWVQLNPDTYLASNTANLSIAATSGGYIISDQVVDSKGHISRGSFTLLGSENVSLSLDGSAITITSQNDNDNYTYSLGTTTGTTQANLILNGANGGTTSSVVLSGGGSVTVTSDANGEITISGSGGVTSLANAFDTSGNFVTTLQTTDGQKASAAIQPKITYGATGSTVDAAFESGTAVLDVYTKAQVDSLIDNELATANAMTYKGTVDLDSANTKLSSSGNVGDTYKADSSFTYNGMNIKTGDLLIAQGTDGNVTWDLIPSGDDQVIQGEVAGNTARVYDQAGTIAQLTVNGSTSNYGNITVSSATSGNALTLTVSHGAAGSGTTVAYASASGANIQSYNTAVDVPTITGISLDDAGHVTSVSANTFTLTDTHANIRSVGISSSVADNIATLTVNVQDTDNTSKSGQFSLSSNNLQITQTSATINGNAVYTVNADFVWGTF